MNFSFDTVTKDFFHVLPNNWKVFSMYAFGSAILNHKLMRFSIVGGIGFLVDTGILYALIGGTGLDRYSGRVISFLMAATTTWILNRSFTFGDTLQKRPLHREWVFYLGLMILGGLVNYGAYALTMSLSKTFYDHPVLAVAAGALSGLAVNFSTSKKLLSRQSDDSP